MPRTEVPTLVLAVQYALPRIGLPAAVSFRRWVQAALQAAEQRGAVELALRLVDAEEGRALNAAWRGKDYATNVLSFPPAAPPDSRRDKHPRHLGDLVLCAPVVASEAATQAKSLLQHYAHLTVHGVLHLLGHDHLADNEAKRMEALETRILERLRIPDPYIER